MVTVRCPARCCASAANDRVRRERGVRRDRDFASDAFACMVELVGFSGKPTIKRRPYVRCRHTLRSHGGQFSDTRISQEQTFALPGSRHSRDHVSGCLPCMSHESPFSDAQACPLSCDYPTRRLTRREHFGHHKLAPSATSQCRPADGPTIQPEPHLRH